MRKQKPIVLVYYQEGTPFPLLSLVPRPTYKTKRFLEFLKQEYPHFLKEPITEKRLWLILNTHEKMINERRL